MISFQENPFRWMLDGITLAIYKEFGKEYGIYADSSGQDLKTPYFTVKDISPSRGKEISNTYRFNLLFMVQYFPKSETAQQAEITDVLNRLYNCLEKVNCINGTKMEPNITDNILSFQVSYQFRGTEKMNFDTAGNMKIDYAAR